MPRKSAAEQAHDHQMAIKDQATSLERRRERARLHPPKPCYICGATADEQGLLTHDPVGHQKFSG